MHAHHTEEATKKKKKRRTQKLDTGGTWGLRISIFDVSYQDDRRKNDDKDNTCNKHT
jgi:hypothetical protein